MTTQPTSSRVILITGSAGGVGGALAEAAGAAGRRFVFHLRPGGGLGE